MLAKTNLKQNADWIRYLLLFNGNVLNNELNDKSVIIQHFGFANKYKFADYFNNFDSLYKDLTNETVKAMFMQKMHSRFHKFVNNFLTGTLGTNIVKLDSVQLKIK